MEVRLHIWGLCSHSLQGQREPVSVSQGPGLGHSNEKACMGSFYIPTKKATWQVEPHSSVSAESLSGTESLRKVACVTCWKEIPGD